MILETKQVLFRAHVHSLDRRPRNAHDHFEQTILFRAHLHSLDRRYWNGYGHLEKTIYHTIFCSHKTLYIFFYIRTGGTEMNAPLK